jgi:hypothetical protein
MSQVKLFLLILFNLPSTIYIIVVGVITIIPMHKRGEIDLWDKDSVKEAVKKLVDPFLEYRKHINWIFWILITLLMFR